jgi:prepilin-type processing-associated H-X9-DG protein
LRTWLESRVELDPAAETDMAAVHLDIETYCATAGYRYPGSQHVSRFLADRQFSRGRRHRLYCDGHVQTVKGLRLKPRAEPESLRLARAH